MEKYRPKVFVLDDDQDFLDETKRMLEETGNYDVAVCPKPTDSLYLLRSFQPDCLILDLRMPLFDGESFLPWIRRQFPDLAIVVCTGISGYNVRILSQFKVKYIIEKPFNQEAFLQTLDAAIDKNSPPAKLA